MNIEYIIDQECKGLGLTQLYLKRINSILEV